MDLAPFTIAGIVNVTPDSFSDGGLFFDHEKALARCLDLLAQGAAILDIGGESTRPAPDSLPVGEAEEERRVLPVVRQLARLREESRKRGGPSGSGPEQGEVETPAVESAGGGTKFAPSDFYAPEQQIVPPENLLVSVDTWRAGTAVACLEGGADIINDISGGTFDPALSEVLAAYRPGYILGHCPKPPATMQNSPRYDDVLEELYGYFAARVESLVKAGLPERNIVIDPCFGFGKNLRHNLELMRGLDRLLGLGLPLCVALSRKTLIGNLLGLPLGEGSNCRRERDMPTQVLSALLLERGGLLHRVHDVAGAWRALRLAYALRRD